MMLWEIAAYLSLGCICRIWTWTGNEWGNCEKDVYPRLAKAGLICGVVVGILTWPLVVVSYFVGVLIRIGRSV